MAQVKYLDLNGLKTLFGVVDSKVSQAVADKATKAELQAVEAKVDSIDVEASLEGYAKESYVDSAIEGLNVGQYAKSADVESTYAKKSEIPTDFYSKEEVDSAIEDAKEAIVGEDLKDALDTLETVKNWKEQHGSEYTKLLAEVQNKANSKDVYTKSETDEKIAEVIADSVDLEPYAKKSEVAETYATNEKLQSLQEAINKSIESKGYATETYINGKINDLNISQYALKSEIPTDYLTEEDIEDFITEEALAPYAKTADLDTFVPFTPEEIQGASNA